MALVPIDLIMLQSDLGTSLVLIAIMIGIMFTAFTAADFWWYQIASHSNPRKR
ncbi:hypothetical protein PGRAN_06061 [Listeria grandensis FSL F6-0971]|uniref:Uncharacterized protein n=1 Tax=Listeria grandensis FSL F6-0971 TaxID=1265819 RepID=W7BDC4_9LIST|nr:hypothetical protein PGRAN_06061 [Listeria grandensis FSL F6-0971]